MTRCRFALVLFVGLALAALAVTPALSCPPKDLPEGSGYLGEESPRVESMQMPGPYRTLEYRPPPRPLTPVIPLPPPKGGRVESSPVPQPVPYPLPYRLPRPQQRPVFRIPPPPVATPITLPRPAPPYAIPITLPRPVPPFAIPINIP